MTQAVLHILKNYEEFIFISSPQQDGITLFHKLHPYA
jgi:hypothetical protein